MAASQVPVAFQGLATVASLVRGSKPRLIGVTTKGRHPKFLNVLTVSESGLAGFEFNSWFALLAPAGTAKDIIAKLNAEVVKALADPDVRDKLNMQGVTPRGTSADELGTLTKAQFEKYARLIKEAGIKADWQLRASGRVRHLHTVVAVAHGAVPCLAQLCSRKYASPHPSP